MIRIRNLQLKYYLDMLSLERWPFNKTHDFKDHITDLLYVLSDLNLLLQIHDLLPYRHHIKGGNILIHKFIAQLIYLKHIDLIRKICTLYLD